MKHSPAYKVLFTTILLLILVYRLYILFTYGAHRIDEDQALMWYGTASFLSGGIDEPHFLGQKYGSMLESIVAVPFYCMGVPLNYAVPLSTIILWVAPFVLCAYYAGRKNELIACLILLVSLCCNYDYDVITNIPRSFLSGFIVSAIGVILLIEDFLNVEYRMIICPIIFSLAFVITDSSLAISCIGLLYYIIKQGKITYINRFIIGSEIGLLLILYCNKIFYIFNKEYEIYVSEPFFVPSFDVLKANLDNLCHLMCSYSFVNVNHVPLTLIIILILLMYLCSKDNSKKTVFIYVAIMLGFFCVLTLTKSLDFKDRISYSQVRIFLFFPYSLALLLYFLSKDIQYYIDISKYTYSFLIIIISVLVFKVVVFSKALEEDRDLYRTFIRSEQVKVLCETASHIQNLASRNNCDIVVVLGVNPLVGYSSAALNYGRYESYNAYFERRNNIYKKYKNHDIDNNVILVYIKNNRVDKVDIVHVSGNLVRYLSDKYDTGRDFIFKHSPGVYLSFYTF